MRKIGLTLVLLSQWILLSTCFTIAPTTRRATVGTSITAGSTTAAAAAWSALKTSTVQRAVVGDESEPSFVPVEGGGSTRTTKTSAAQRKKVWTAADVRADMLANPAKYQRAAVEVAVAMTKSKAQKNSKRSRRTRQRVTTPQQRYLYASQRKLQEATLFQNQTTTTTTTTTLVSENFPLTDASPPRSTVVFAPLQRSPDVALAKELGLLPALQHCDAILGSAAAAVPVILGQIRVAEDDGSTAAPSSSSSSSSLSWAYLIDKPAGWAILGSAPAKPAVATSPHSTTTQTTTASSSSSSKTLERNDYIQRVSVRDNGSVDVLEYNELDVLALMTTEEIADYQLDIASDEVESKRVARLLEHLSQKSTDSVQQPALETASLHNQIPSDTTGSAAKVDPKDHAASSAAVDDDEGDTSQTAANLRRIAARASSTDASMSGTASSGGATATFSTTSQRPSVVAWLKETKARLGTPIRGGNVWTAVAGAVDVDDSGLVLLCPKVNAHQCVVEYAEYLAVVGNGGYVDPAAKKTMAAKKSLSMEPPQLEIISKLRKGRGEDVVQTVSVVVAERESTCASVRDACQTLVVNGIRGDAAASPLDRRAPRRLIHCQSMSVSSLIHDDSVTAQTTAADDDHHHHHLPDDIAVWSERRNHLTYHKGSFLGRAALRKDASTTAYREINGAADGFPGWTVDRYGEWLLVTHDPKQPKGPLPSIHDGYTAGVYYLESSPDRSTMAETDIRPRLLEGRPAPDMFPILENGVTYLVSIHRDLSTGLFLDQRPQRAWLTRHCTRETRILNCFAHTGAFSVAAAVAGASTVSLDLSKKWLDRLPLQLEANGIAFDERHDCVYGDCFDWLVRLAKRQEKYDIVILDPPSTSVGQKRKRWSVKDMNELVALASGLVKPGGLLWTTTNSASMPVAKFASLCRQGLVEAGFSNAKLERIQPMPVDFPSIGPQPVKNLVWRIP
jgi:23S rRNA (cytosine1962-C5)-methyltransferase